MRVVICGAGVIGLNCAHYLRERGHEVTVVERETRERDACSFGNMGMVLPSHFVPLAAPGVVPRALKWMFDSASPFYVRPRVDPDFIAWAFRFIRAANAKHASRSSPLMRDLLFASRRLYEELADRTANELGLVKRGMLILCRTAHGLDEEAQAAAVANALGVPGEVVSPARAAELDPGAQMDIVGAVYYPLDCHLTPARLMATLLDLTEAAGVNFRWSTEVTGWRTSNARIEAAKTTAGELAADAFVLAGGSWSPAIVRGLGIKLSLQAGKGYSVTLTRPRELPQLCSALSEARVAVTPMGSSLRIGGTMELTGMNRTIRNERVRAIIDAATRYFPALRPEDFRDAPPWAGLRPCSPDGLPYVGRFARYPNLCAATGHATMGVSLGPITGKLVAEILSDGTPSIAIEALAPDRYA
ncbi:MAG: FAD-dependent oxidoreductase [Gammaproteobacteria bacterium]